MGKTFPRNKKGTDTFLSVYWFAIIFIVAAAVVYMVYVFYGAPYDIRSTESTLLSNQIADCLTPQNFFNDAALTNQFQQNFLQNCHLNFSTESGYNGQGQYYAEVLVYKFDSSVPNLLGKEVANFSVGDPNVLTAWELGSSLQGTTPSSSIGKVKYIIIHTTDGPDTLSAIQTISQNKLSINYMIDRNGNIISYSNEPQYASSQYQNAFVQSNSQIAQDAGCIIGQTTLTACSASCESNGLLNPVCQNAILGGNSFGPNQGVSLSDPGCCIPNFNQVSIGIELVNMGPQCTQYPDSAQCANNMASIDGQNWEKFSSAQINSLVDLVSSLAKEYNIPVDRNHIIGHYQITTYKTDPGPAFNWTTFIQEVQAKVNSQSTSSLSSTTGTFPQGQWRSFYAVDSSGSQYIVQVLALIRKTEKNVAT